MPAPTTTLDDIRAWMVRRIECIVPQFFPNRRFNEHHGDMPLEDWAENSPFDAMRFFEIRRVEELLDPASSNVTTEELSADIEIAIAYPRDWARFEIAKNAGAKGVEDAMNKDRRCLMSRAGIGLHAFGDYISGLHRSVIEHTVDDGDKAVLSVFTATVTYYSAVLAA